MGMIKRNSSMAAGHDAARERRGHARDIAGLLGQLGDADAGVRRWAAHDLAGVREASAALVARLGVESEPSVRTALLIALSEIGDAVAVSGLVECLRSDDAALRNDALDTLKLLPDAVAPIMQDLLSDPDPDVRIFSVNVLESLRHPDVEQWLCAVIDRDPHINVCATAVDLLGEVGTPASEGSLLRLKARFAQEPYIGFAADLALRRIGEK